MLIQKTCTNLSYAKNYGNNNVKIEFKERQDFKSFTNAKPMQEWTSSQTVEILVLEEVIFY